MELFKLLGIIAINNSAANAEIDQTTKKAEESNSKIGSAFKKIGIAAVAAGATAVAAVTKMAVSNYASYEQLVGGVDTLFKTSSQKVQQYANEAYKTAGMSANDYMETVTSFSASLIQSLSGDTKKAAEYGNQAVIDMSDNANKMGTSIDSIQQTYQSLARGNYMMLDNLKLGYGGTKTEMERLLADAQKLTGQKYDVSNFADVTQAIHAIQTEMGITGTTAKEAATTIDGSVASMKASWSNLLTGIASGNQDTGKLFGDFAQSVQTMLGNIVPRVGITLKGLFSLFGNLGNQLQGKMPEFMSKGAEMLDNLGNGIKNKMPGFISKGLDAIMGFTATLRQNAPKLIQSGLNLVLNLAKGLANSMPALIAKVPTIVSNIAGIINDNAPKLLITAGKIILALVNGLIKSIPTLVKNIPKIIKAIIDALLAFNWLKLGKTIITKLKDGFIGENPAIKNAAKKVLDAIINALKQLPQKLYNLGKQALSKLVSILKHTASIKGAASAIKNEIVRILAKLPGQMLTIGKNLVKGLWNGIGNAKNWILSKVKGFGKSILDGLKNFFGIHSPSKVMEEQVGKQLALGVARGIDNNKKYAKKSATQMAQIVLDAATKRLDKYKTYNDISLAAEKAYWDKIRKECKKGTEARLQADKNYYEVKKSLNEKLKEAEETYKSAIEAVNQKIEDRKNVILQSFSLFEKFSAGDAASKTELTDSLQSQVNALRDWQNQMNNLKGRLGDSPLFDALKEMGVQSLSQVKAINSMSDDELKKYDSLYKERSSIAEKQASIELKADTTKGLKEAKNTWISTCNELGVKVKATGTGIVSNIKSTTTKIAKTVASKMGAATKSVVSAVEKMKKTMKFSWSLPKLKIPHVTISGAFSLDPPKTPKFGVDWYANGAVLNKPTVFGLNGNRPMVGGESGPEAIAPISTLQSYIIDAVQAVSNRITLADIEILIIKILKSIKLVAELDGDEMGKFVIKTVEGEVFR